MFDETGRRFTVGSVRPHGDRLLVTFDEVPDRTAAEALAGTTLVVPESWLPALGEGEWWAYAAEGLRVRTEDGRTLGSVREVLHYPAQDLWRIVAEDGAEILLPAVEELIVSVDLHEGSAVVRSLPGLTAPAD